MICQCRKEMNKQRSKILTRVYLHPIYTFWTVYNKILFVCIPGVVPGFLWGEGGANPGRNLSLGSKFSETAWKWRKSNRWWGVGGGGCWRVSAFTILPCRFCWNTSVHVCGIGCDFQGSFTLSCSMWILNWILCESIWRRCHFRVQHYSPSRRQNRSRLCLVQFMWNGKNP